MNIEKLKEENDKLLSEGVKPIKDSEIKEMANKYREYVVSTITKDELIEAISNKLLISLEDAKSFVHGTKNGYMVTNQINVTIALASRDMAIERLRKRVEFLEEQLDGEGI